MPEEKRIPLAEHWASVQARMLADLVESRTLPHPGSSGSASEADWARWLEGYLPARYAVGRGVFVIDSTGLVSQQLDVVIYDKHFTPRIWRHNEDTYVPAESVYAVLECKPELNRANLDYAAEKVSSVRRMLRTSARFHDNSSGAQRPVASKPIIGVLLADRSEWAVPLGDPFTNALAEQEPDRRIDLVCAVEHVGASTQWCERGTPTVKQVNGAFALIGFFSELVSKLQSIGSVAAIDYNAYTDMLEWTETGPEAV
jgi:hypothetical protein